MIFPSIRLSRRYETFSHEIHVFSLGALYLSIKITFQTKLVLCMIYTEIGRGGIKDAFGTKPRREVDGSEWTGHCGESETLASHDSSSIPRVFAGSYSCVV